jgi:hypothetical protein
MAVNAVFDGVSATSSSPRWYMGTDLAGPSHDAFSQSFLTIFEG